MKKTLFYLLIILSVFILGSCNKKSGELTYQKILPLEKNTDVSLVVTSDLHFLSNETVSTDSYMKRPQYDGDGRIIVYNEELIEAFIDEMLKTKPDGVIITGDLSFNGAYLNHQELAKKLNKLVDEGIRVLVSPGNHDLNRNDSVKFLTSTAEKIKTTTSKEFYQLYYNCGFGNSLMMDKDSLSYAYQISEDLIILMLDSCLYLDGNNYQTQVSGEIKASTIEFVETVLSDAKEKDAQVIVTAHHNLLTHSSLFIEGYQLNNHQAIQELLEKYDVNLFLSGHMHIQHITSTEQITEILTSSLAMTPHQYGQIVFQPHKQIDYQTKSVDVDNYYASLNSTNSDLLNFKKYSFDFFTKSSYEKTYGSIMFENDTLHDYALACAKAQSILNPAYFGGFVYLVLEEVKADPSYDLWQSYPNRSNYRYLQSMIESGTKDHTKETILLSS